MIINIGGYDVNNFGDLLFPYIVNHFVDEEVIHFSLTGSKTSWNDSIVTKSFYFLDKYAKEASAIILGGGHLISIAPTNIEEFSKIDNLKKMAYPSFWIYPTFLANKYRIPIIWSSVGIQNILSAEFKGIGSEVFKQIDYLSVRDSFSKSIVNKLGVNCSLLPDTVLDIDKVFPLALLRQTYLDFLIANGISNKKKIAIFHLKNRYLDCEIEEVSFIIESIAKSFGVVPILIPLGQCHEDDKLLDKIKQINPTFKFILNNYSLKLVLSLIANSEFYCGSSLHGYIAAMSYNIKGVIIADEQTVSFRKFSGFLNFFKQENFLINSWKNDFEIVEKLKQDYIFKKDRSDILLKAHWGKINSIIANKKPYSLQKPSLEQFEIVKTVIDFFK